MSMKIYCLLSGIFLLFPLGVQSQAPGIPENFEVRQAYQDLILGPIHELVSSQQGAQQIWRQVQSAHRVRYRTEQGGDFLYLLFLNEKDSSFPIPRAGNYIIKRDRRDGNFRQIKVFFRNESDSFVRIFPLDRGQRSAMDVFLFGRIIYHQVILPFHFTYLLTAPFSKITQATRVTVDWPLLLFTGQEEINLRTEGLLEGIRGYLPHLPDGEDGALDEGGRLVFISDGTPQGPDGGLNCSGFSKWVVDGFLLPRGDKALGIDRLKTRHLQHRGHRWSSRYELERDPYFGLDWSRNLAASLKEVEFGRPLEDPEANDVRNLPLLHYVEDVGYPLSALNLALYLDYRAHPGSFYIGSVNREIGGSPALRQHFHLVVLFPYFSREGAFQVTVLERNRETGVDSLERRYKDHHMHLVRLNLGSQFTPQQLKNPPR